MLLSYFITSNDTCVIKTIIYLPLKLYVKLHAYINITKSNAYLIIIWEKMKFTCSSTIDADEYLDITLHVFVLSV